MTDQDIEGQALCVTCGTLYHTSLSSPPGSCKICDDPRQFVPPAGQSWTSLAQIRSEHHNVWHEVIGRDDDAWWIRTEPQVGIGQRCFLISTPHGNVLWDCISLLDEDTIARIRYKGGLNAIVISHPHFYSTHLLWAKTFDCPVYVAAEDEEWCTVPGDGRREHIKETVFEVIPDVNAVKLGGHFPGSLVLHWKPQDAEGYLFIADTLMVAPSALYFKDRPPGTISFSFAWSYPNHIPLPPTDIFQMWGVLKKWDFSTAVGGFTGQDVQDPKLKARVLESMKIQCRAMGWKEDQAEIFAETL